MCTRLGSLIYFAHTEVSAGAILAAVQKKLGIEKMDADAITRKLKCMSISDMVTFLPEKFVQTYARGVGSGELDHLPTHTIGIVLDGGFGAVALGISADDNGISTTISTMSIA